MYYFRKLAKPSNLQKLQTIDKISDVEADLIKDEFRTTKNELSFWKCESLDSQEDIENTFKAIILSGNKFEVLQIIVCDEVILKKYGLEMKDSEGDTKYIGFKNTHSDMIKLNYKSIADVLAMYKEVALNTDNKFYPKLEKSTEYKYIKEAKNSELIAFDDLDERFAKEIEKYCS